MKETRGSLAFILNHENGIVDLKEDSNNQNIQLQQQYRSNNSSSSQVNCETKLLLTETLDEVLNDQGDWAYLSNLSFRTNNSAMPIKPKRKRADAYQLNFLEEVFKLTTFPSTYQRIRIGQKLNMAPRAVQIWFQNKRKAHNIKRCKNKEVSDEEKQVMEVNGLNLDYNGNHSNEITPPFTFPLLKNIVNDSNSMP